MGKDPAFLFYTSDFLTGTILMSNEEIGIYIKLLCIQHQHNGYIKNKDFHAIALQHSIVIDKFLENKYGFYNQSL